MQYPGLGKTGVETFVPQWRERVHAVKKLKIKTESGKASFVSLGLFFHMGGRT
jgi:hypothetical protein